MAKKLLLIITALALITFAFTSCDMFTKPDNNADSENSDNDIVFDPNNVTFASAYAQAKDLGFTGTLDEFIELVSGKDGADGKDGVPGKDGVGITSVLVDDNGHLLVYFTDGTSTDCGLVKGEDGKDATGGNATMPTIEISEDGYWVINGVKTEHKAIGVDGTNGTNGKDGASIKEVIFDDQGRLVITLTDGNVLDPIELPEKEEHIHEPGEWNEFNGSKEMLYAICMTCKEIVWKFGECNTHTYNETYSYDNSFHWLDCKYCDATTSYAEHNIDDSGLCTVCNQPLGETEGIVYEISKDGTYASVVDYTGTAAKVIIADSYRGVPVTHIGGEVFNENESITSVFIPKSIISIDLFAFTNCTNLTSVIISDIAAWCNISFANQWSNPLYYAKNLYLDGDLITELVIPDGVTSIGNCAFWGCSSFTSVTIPDGVTNIGEGAFAYCTALTSVTIPNGVMSIGDSAFSHCTNLASVTLPDSVTYIGGFVFSSCNSALYTEYEYGKYVCSGDNPYAVLVELIDKNLSTYTINANTKFIGGSVFLRCNNLTNITIPDRVTSIGSYAFYECTALTSVTIPDEVKNIGEVAFRDCTALTTVTIGNGVTNIGDGAFYNCTGLTSVTIGKSVTSIGSSAFHYCCRLTNVTIPDSVTSIGDNAFESCTSLISIIIPDKVTSIGSDTFYNCTSITSVTIGKMVTSIGSSAFEYCSSLTSVTIPDSVTNIGDNAFSECRKLTSVVIGNSVKSIGDWAFYNCTNIANVYYTGSEEEWSEISIGKANSYLTTAPIHYNYVPEE